VSTRHCDITPK